MPVLVERSAEQRMGNKLLPNGSPASLVDRIRAALPKTPNQRLIVKQVGPVNFRANWLSVNDNGNTTKTWKFDESRFLHVVDQGNSLVIKDKTVKGR